MHVGTSPTQPYRRARVRFPDALRKRENATDSKICTRGKTPFLEVVQNPIDTKFGSSGHRRRQTQRLKTAPPITLSTRTPYKTSVYFLNQS